MSLAKALKAGNTKAIETIIQSDEFDPNMADPKTGETSLHLLAKEDETDLLKEVLAKFTSSSERPANLEQQDKEGKTPLATALLAGASDAAVVLLNFGADPNAQLDRESMLMLAASIKRDKLAAELIRKGADINYTNKKGSALHYAVQEDNEMLAKALLHRSDVNLAATNSKKQNVLHTAVERYAVNVIPLLVEKLKEVDAAAILTAKEEQGRCPVHVAAANMRQNLVSLLEKSGKAAGIDYELLDSRGLTSQELMREIEDEKRAALNLIEKEKEAAKQKKAQEKAAERAKEAKANEVEKQLLELQRLKKKQEKVIEEESKRKAPYMLLMFAAIVILFLYLLLKIGVATGATQKATRSVESEIEELVDM